MSHKEKGQAFTWDVVLATAVFMIVLGIIIFQWSSLISALLSSNEEYKVSWLATAASEQLVRTTGTPIDWFNWTAPQNSIVFGLADYEVIENNTRPLDRVVDPDKFYTYINQSKNYTWMRYKMLGSGVYDYYAKLSCLNDEGIDCFNGLVLSQEYREFGPPYSTIVTNTSCANDVSFSTWSFFIYAISNTRNLSGAWRFSEGVGITGQDSSGNNNPCKFDYNYGPRWVFGRTGKALKFDAIDDEVRCWPTNTALDLDKNMTIMAWIKPTILPGKDMSIVSKRKNAAGFIGYMLGINATNDELMFPVSPTIATVEYVHSSGANLTNDTWQHVAVTYAWDGASYSVSFYKNGTLISTPVVGNGRHYSSADSLFIGSNELDTDWFNGSIQDVRVYSRALTEEEIYNISNLSTQYCVLGNMNTSLNDTSYVAYDTKTFTFSHITVRPYDPDGAFLGLIIAPPAVFEDIPRLNETARIMFAVYKKKNKSE